jgi:hypothetical protein
MVCAGVTDLTTYKIRKSPGAVFLLAVLTPL